MKSLASIILLIFTSSPLLAEVYKWVDEDGNTHYSQSPPVSDVDVKKIDTGKEKDTTAAQEQLSNQTEKADALREERLKKAEEKAKLAEEKKLKEENCIQAKKAKESYTVNTRVLVKEDDGSQRRITEEERQEKISNLQEQINEYCN